MGDTVVGHEPRWGTPVPGEPAWPEENRKVFVPCEPSLTLTGLGLFLLSKPSLASVRGSSRPHGEFSRGGKNVGEASGKAVHGFSPQNQSICLKLFIPHPAPGRRVSARHAGHCRAGEAPIPVSGRQPQGMPQPPWGAAGSILKRKGSAPWGSKDERWLLQRLP